ncbi:hypothetical protein ABPG75_004924 [Micractinium tetrahymenae]
MPVITINGRQHDLEGADPAQSLAAYCRECAGDQSVRVACGSGACGACAVAAVPPGRTSVLTINACLAPVGSLAGYQVMTAAGVGNSKQGFHPVQERMGAFHASQCGYCTPGIVAALGGALTNAQLEDGAGAQPGPEELARCLDGNLCRCTGYRPIMDVCKSFASGVDIEDLGLHAPLADGAAAAAAGCPLLLQPGTPPAADGKTPLRIEAGGRTWLAPTSLEELIEACAAQRAAGNDAAAPPPRFLAGNTGSGLFHDLWPAEDRLVVGLGRVRELRAVTPTESHLVVGAAVTIAELVSALSSHAASAGKAPSAAGAATAGEPCSPFASLAAMLARIAGAHVRQAGTVGGNLVLAKRKGLESDLATALLGWGATALVLDVAAAAPSNGGNGSGGAGPHTEEVPLEAFLSAGHNMAPSQLLVALSLPLPAGGDYFLCTKVAPAHSSVHATMNAAVKLSGLSGDSSAPTSATIVLGYHGGAGWVAQRARAAEAALTGAKLGASSLASALRALCADVAPGQHPQEFAAMAQGLLLQAVGPVVRERCAAGGGCLPRLDRLLQVPPASVPPAVMGGRQEFDPAPSAQAPLGAPLEKDRVLLQTSGEAQYTADVPAPAGTLHAAWVTSSEACATIASIDASAALQLPRVVTFLSAEDLPGELNHVKCGLPMLPEELFARGQVVHHAQPLGLVVAETQVGMRILAARKRSGWCCKTLLRAEECRVLLWAAPHSVDRWRVLRRWGGQHPCWEGTRGDCRALQQAAAVDIRTAVRPAQLPTSRGHACHAAQPAMPRQNVPTTCWCLRALTCGSSPSGCNLAGFRLQDAAMRAARAVRVEYGPPEQPGVFSIEQARERSSFYNFPGPFGCIEKQEGDPAGAIAGAERRILGGTVRVPGNYHMYLEPQNALAIPDEGGCIKVHAAAQSIDAVQRAVAHALGVRQHSVEAVCRRVGGGFGGKATRNLPVAVAAAVAAVKTGRPVRLVQDRATDMRLNGGRCEVLAEYDAGFSSEGVIQGLSLRIFCLLGAFPDFPMDGFAMAGMITMAYNIPNVSLSIKQCKANLPTTTFMRAPGDAQAAFIIESIMERVALDCGLGAAAVRERNFVPAPPAGAETVRLSMGKEMPAVDYTLPRLWQHVKAASNYERRAAEVAAFNEGSPWLKRGLGLTHTRFDVIVQAKSAYVSIFADGSVAAFAGGAELGQGLTTKVKQTVLAELSQLLPEGSRPLPAELVRIVDQTTNVLPAASVTGGSTTSEAACHGIKAACQVLVKRLQPLAEKLGPEGTWADLMKAVAGANAMASCAVPLSAFGHTSELGSEGARFGYTIWGAACTEAEVNLLTGERQILRSDLVMDVGRSLNPAIDIGQVEGAFAQGLGMALSEARRVDPSTGRLLTDSLWDYHAPTASAMPRQLNVALLPGSRMERSTLGAKAVGEPPLMLATSALSALQAAVRAGHAELAALGTAGGHASGGEAGGADGEAALLRLPVSAENVVAAVAAGSGRDLAGLFGTWAGEA